MPRGSLQRRAKIRSHCTLDSYDRALLAVRGKIEPWFDLNPYLAAGSVLPCPKCGNTSLVDTYGNWPFRRLPPEERWFCFGCMRTSFDKPE